MYLGTVIETDLPRRGRLAAALLPAPLPEHRARHDGRSARQARQAALSRAARPRQRHRHPLHGRGRRASDGHAPRRDIGRRGGLGGAAAAVPQGVPRLPGRRARSRRDEVGRPRRFHSRHARRRPARFRRRAGSRHVPPRRLQHGRDDGADVRHALPGTAADGDHQRHRHRPRAALERRPATHGSPTDRARGADVGRAAGEAPRARFRARVPGSDCCPRSSRTSRRPSC